MPQVRCVPLLLLKLAVHHSERKDGTVCLLSVHLSASELWYAPFLGQTLLSKMASLRTGLARRATRNWPNLRFTNAG